MVSRRKSGTDVFAQVSKASGRMSAFMRMAINRMEPGWWQRQPRTHQYSHLETLEQRMLLSGATITGTVFDDTDSDGRLGAGDDELKSVRIFVDANGNSVWDGGETSAFTKADGSFTLNNVDPGRAAVTLGSDFCRFLFV